MSKSSYRQGILISTVSTFLGHGMVMAAGIMLAKTLAPENLGKFFSDQALVLLGTGLINLGIGHGYRQIVSRRPELRDSYLLPVVFVRIAAMVLYLGALSAYLHYVGRWNLPTVLVVVGTLAFNLLELYQIDLQISRRYSRVAVLILSRGLVLLVAATICWHARAKYDSLVISYFVFSFLVIILGWFIVKPAVASIFRFNYGRLIKTSIPFSAAIFVYAFTSFWGLTYVRSVLGDEQAGYYAIPLRVYQIAVVLGMSVSGVTLPLFHKLAAAREFGVYAGAFGRLVRGMWLICGPIVALCCFIPGFLIRVFASEQYMSAAAIFPWIGFATAFRLVALPAGNIFECVDRQWYRVIIQSIGAVACMVGVVLIVPKWGIIGAAWTLFGVDLWILLAYWFVSGRLIPSVVSLRKLVIPGFLLCGVFGLCYFAGFSAWLKVLLFCFVWTGYVMIGLNFKEEVGNVLKVMLRRT